MQNNKRLHLGLILTSSLLLQACGSSSNDSDDAISKDVVLDTTPPSITQLFPNNNVGIQSRLVTISGEISDESLASVEISYGDDMVSAVLDGNHFSAVIPATLGENTYSVIATDEAGNESTSRESFYFGARASAGGSHSGLIKNHRIYTWGRNNKGQAGIGFITSVSDDPADAEAEHPISPTLISAQSEDAEEIEFVSLAFNQNASSALDVNGNVWTWGDGDEGQLGLGVADDDMIDEEDRTRPQKITGLTDVVSVSRGLDHCLALKADGSVYAFGSNANGQLGDGTDQNQDSPVLVNGLSDIVQISASIGSYAIDKDGRLWAWGSNKYGQLANGTKDSDVHSSPVQIEIDEPVVSIASGKGHALALTQSGKVYAWGLNASSQVGLNASETWEDYIYSPTLLPWFDDATAVWAKGNQSFVQRRDGKIYPWGQNMLGTLGIEQDDDVEQPESPIYGLENVVDLGNGALHTLAIRDDGQLFSWGWSFEGSLGGGDSTIHMWTYRLPLFISVPE